MRTLLQGDDRGGAEFTSEWPSCVLRSSEMIELGSINEKAQQHGGEAAVGLTLQWGAVYPPGDSGRRSPAGGAFDEHV